MIAVSIGNGLSGLWVDVRSQTESFSSVDVCHSQFDSVRMYDLRTGQSTHMK